MTLRERHVITIEERSIDGGPLEGCWEWRWVCSCGSHAATWLLGQKGAAELRGQRHLWRVAKRLRKARR